MDVFMGIVWLLVIGLVAGAIARLLVPGKDAMSIPMTMLLGIAGSFVGGLIMWALWRESFVRSGVIGSIIGAVIVLLLVRAVRGRTGARHHPAH
ncbi:GlsB/YeaQ/YmgE family stress response membrane protein [Allostreptomyces psammosilenae]|uniref:Putative membrane protein YeaQ/YmgE (Transglycosylase-associated protein family) n=1 Tax=Allostreptomyces psammosilenae TaxID=1892865 RepID=A0A852ZVS0_9ACTN|nr:GlsB/YeaQ/YmgE family stress response membrane protein [Allostreptomyces psammosilenae]NYI06329.1 putative membrane protein YeaQ/YmgE (transglycosylase-associated protein family) [Allostreptomyces psammosilenae]